MKTNQDDKGMIMRNKITKEVGPMEERTELRKKKKEAGLSLIELLVVVAIMGILATLTAVAVTGTATTTKGATKANDEKTVSDAISAYSGEHTQGRLPTLDGCGVGEGFGSVTKTCSIGTATGDGHEEFGVNEAFVGVDVNDDGDTVDTVRVVPILWDQFFTADGAAEALTAFVETPTHGFDLISGSDWESTTTGRLEDGVLVTNPFNSSAGSGDFVTCAAGTAGLSNPASGDVTLCPVWVINPAGDAIALLTSGTY